MKKNILFLGLIIILTSHSIFASVNGPDPSVFYSGSYDNMLRDAKKLKKNIVLRFGGDWCNSCNKLDNETFSDTRLTEFLGDHFIVYKINIDSPLGKEITEKFNVDIFPTLLILDYRTKEVSRLKGFHSANSLSKLLKEIPREARATLDATDNFRLVTN
jgi:thioredoxin 1